MFYLFLPLTTECENSFYIYSKKKVWTEIWCSQRYKRIRIVNIIRTYLKQKIYSWTLFVRSLHKIFFFRKKNKPMKYNLARTIIFCSSCQKIFIFLCDLEQIKLLQSAFQKWYFYLEEFFHWYIPKNGINQNCSYAWWSCKSKLSKGWNIETIQTRGRWNQSSNIGIS